MFESLERRISGIRLLNVRTVRDGENIITLATVYVPYEKRPIFLRMIERYGEEETSSGKPKNQPLMESISQIREATLVSFWQRNEFDSVPSEEPVRMEAWLLGDSDELPQRFASIAAEIGIEIVEGLLRFPERTIIPIEADRNQLGKLIASFDGIAEFRLAKHLATYYVDLENADQTEFVQELLGRCVFDDREGVSVCILDSGVNNGHPLIQPVLSDRDRTAVVADWPSTDDPMRPHGTLMAGTATYGNLLTHLNSNQSVQILHRIESVRILPPYPKANPKELWGYRVSQGASISEINEPHRRRVYCLAVTARETADRGHPSSWSATMDQLASGQGDGHRRLFVVAAGNSNESAWTAYPEGNQLEEIHDPGQSWNAVTVGAYTELTAIRDPSLAGYHALAPFQGLSPFSTTSRMWPSTKWPIKPDIVLEGGNVAAGPNDSRFIPEDLELISTSHDPQVAHFSPFRETSAASALASEMAAKIQVEYPNAWPETIRGLMIHSADWTDEMKRQFLGTESPNKHQIADLLRTCGYGVPNLERALYCASNSLTLVSEAEIQPFDQKDGRIVTRDMHLYDLPWPVEVLRGLAEASVSMRVTLSYFIEPGPGEVGWGDRYRYPSHGLRFDVNGPRESEEEFVHRINVQARDEDEVIETTGATQYWRIGSNNRRLGSVHSDIWTGTAIDLSQSNRVAVYPTTGWWRTRSHLDCWSKRTRYSLIVSIETPEIDNDIYLAVATKIGIATPVMIPTGQ
ncbi:MAG: S8 family peptidase [Spirochaeta sp.]|nr:S8 family peptidase [Spirochaeta sp.]